jgi:hypothetical protein
MLKQIRTGAPQLGRILIIDMGIPAQVRPAQGFSENFLLNSVPVLHTSENRSVTESLSKNWV